MVDLSKLNRFRSRGPPDNRQSARSRGEVPLLNLMKLAEIYGPIFRLSLADAGSWSCPVLNWSTKSVTMSGSTNSSDRG